MSNQPQPIFDINEYVEFYDFRDSSASPNRKIYEGIITNVISSDNYVFDRYTYVIDNKIAHLLPPLQPGKSSIHVYERHIIGRTRPFNIEFLQDNGWFQSTNQNHPSDFYIKNKYPIGFLIDNMGIWAYDARNYIQNMPFVAEPIFSTREYDKLINPIIAHL